MDTNKKDMFSIGFSHGFQYGEYLNKGMMSKLLINRIIKQQKHIYRSGFLNGVEEKIIRLEKERAVKAKTIQDIKAVKQEIAKVQLLEKIRQKHTREKGDLSLEL